MKAFRLNESECALDVMSDNVLVSRLRIGYNDFRHLLKCTIGHSYELSISEKHREHYPRVVREFIEENL